MLAYVLPRPRPAPSTWSRTGWPAGGWPRRPARSRAGALARPPGDQLRAAAARLAAALPISSGRRWTRHRAELPRGVRRRQAQPDGDVHRHAVPADRPGHHRSRAGQLVGLLEWCTSVINDSLTSTPACAPPSRSSANCSAPRRRVARRLGDAVRRTTPARRGAAQRSAGDSVAHLRHMQPDALNYNDAVHLSFHARTVAVATMNAANDALIATARPTRTRSPASGCAGRVASRSAAACPTSGASWPATRACVRCGSSTAPVVRSHWPPRWPSPT